MKFAVEPEINQRTVNLTVMLGKNAWMSVALWTRGVIDGFAELPYTIRKGLTPLRAILCVLTISFISTPTILYVTERGRHDETRSAYRALSVSSAGELSFMRSNLRDLLDERAMLAGVLLESGNTVCAGGKVVVKAIATGYTSSVFETDSTPFTTATNTTTREGILALSRDLLGEYTPGAPFRFGDRVHVSGLGEFLVEDVMNARWTNRIDIWFPSRGEAFRFGARSVYLSRTLDEEPLAESEIISENASAATVASGF